MQQLIFSLMDNLPVAPLQLRRMQAMSGEFIV